MPTIMHMNWLIGKLADRRILQQDVFYSILINGQQQKTCRYWLDSLYRHFDTPGLYWVRNQTLNQNPNRASLIVIDVIFVSLQHVKPF